MTLEDLGLGAKTGTVVNGFGSSVSFTSNAFEDLIHLSGLPTLHIFVTTQACQGGQIFATLYDDTSNLRLGHDDGYQIPRWWL